MPVRAAIRALQVIAEQHDAARAELMRKANGLIPAMATGVDDARLMTQTTGGFFADDSADAVERFSGRRLTPQLTAERAPHFGQRLLPPRFIACIENVGERRHAEA